MNPRVRLRTDYRVNHVVFFLRRVQSKILEVMKQLQDANNTIKAQDQQIKQLQAGKLLQMKLQQFLQDASKIFAISLCK